MLLDHLFIVLCVVCSLMEQKIDRLTEMTAELTRRLLKGGEEGGAAPEDAEGEQADGGDDDDKDDKDDDDKEDVDANKDYEEGGDADDED